MAYQVSEDSIRKVESYIVKRARETGSKTVAEPVATIAKGAGVALATAHKALEKLEKQRIITVVRASSRRNPNEYTYRGDMELFEEQEQEIDQLEYLKELVRELTEKNEALERENRELKGRLRVQNQRQPVRV